MLGRHARDLDQGRRHERGPDLCGHRERDPGRRDHRQDRDLVDHYPVELGLGWELELYPCCWNCYC
jgi:hypothetical protein